MRINLFSAHWCPVTGHADHSGYPIATKGRQP